MLSIAIFGFLEQEFEPVCEAAEAFEIHYDEKVEFIGLSDGGDLQEALLEEKLPLCDAFLLRLNGDDASLAEALAKARSRGRAVLTLRPGAKEEGLFISERCPLHSTALAFFFAEWRRNKERQGKFYPLKGKEGIEKYLYEDIEFFQSDGHYVTLHLLSKRDSTSRSHAGSQRRGAFGEIKFRSMLERF